MQSHISDEELKEFRDFVSAQTGITLHAAADFIILNFLDELMEDKSFDSVEQIIEHLSGDADSDLIHNWIERIYESPDAFFRDFRDFKYFRHSFIPKLLEEKQAKELTVCCIESGLGQESYSLAIMLNEAMPELQDWTIRIVSTESDESLVHRSRQGVFTGREISRGMPVGLVDKSVEKKGTSWQVFPRHRELISFVKQELDEKLKRVPICDIIFLRNVLPKLLEDHREELLAHLAQHLTPGGCLIVGRDDGSMMGSHFSFVQNDQGARVFSPTVNDSETTTVVREPLGSCEEPAADPAASKVTLESDELASLSNILQTLCLIRDSSEEELNEFLERLPIRRYPSHEILLHEGEPNTVLSGVISGELSVSIATGLFGNPCRIATLGEGTVIGEQSVFERTDCSATVRAVTDVAVFEIDQDLFGKLIEEYPEFAAHIREIMRVRLAQRKTFKETGKIPRADKSKVRPMQHQLGMLNEERYELRPDALPRGGKLISFDDDLVGRFMVFARKTALLKGISVAVLDTLARRVCCVSVPANRTMILEESWPSAFYLLYEGKVSVVVGAGIFNRGREITKLGAGEMVGEMSMILGQRANASVVTNTAVRAFAIRRELFEYIYNTNRNFTNHIDRLVAERQRAAK